MSVPAHKVEELKLRAESALQTARHATARVMGPAVVQNISAELCSDENLKKLGS